MFMLELFRTWLQAITMGRSFHNKNEINVQSFWVFFGFFSFGNNFNFVVRYRKRAAEEQNPMKSTKTLLKIVFTVKCVPTRAVVLLRPCATRRLATRSRIIQARRRINSLCCGFDRLSKDDILLITMCNINVSGLARIDYFRTVHLSVSGSGDPMDLWTVRNLTTIRPLKRSVKVSRSLIALPFVFFS